MAVAVTLLKVETLNMKVATIHVESDGKQMEKELLSAPPSTLITASQHFRFLRPGYCRPTGIYSMDWLPTLHATKLQIHFPGANSKP